MDVLPSLLELGPVHVDESLLRAGGTGEEDSRFLKTFPDRCSSVAQAIIMPARIIGSRYRSILSQRDIPSRENMGRRESGRVLHTLHEKDMVLGRDQNNALGLSVDWQSLRKRSNLALGCGIGNVVMLRATSTTLQQCSDVKPGRLMNL